ncbi:hypothetical protein MHBO_002635, partial [Bonamia ostreae]
KISYYLKMSAENEKIAASSRSGADFYEKMLSKMGCDENSIPQFSNTANTLTNILSNSNVDNEIKPFCKDQKKNEALLLYERAVSSVTGKEKEIDFDKLSIDELFESKSLKHKIFGFNKLRKIFQNDKSNNFENHFKIMTKIGSFSNPLVLKAVTTNFIKGQKLF